MRSIRRARTLLPRFDLKDAKTEIIPEQDKIILIADDGAHLKALREIVIGKLSKRGVDLRNVEQEEPAISSVGHARQELKIKQGLEGNKAKEIIQAIKSQGFKVQSQLQDRQIRVTGKKKDDLQAVIQFVRVATSGLRQTLKTSGTEQDANFFLLVRRIESKHGQHAAGFSFFGAIGVVATQDHRQCTCRSRGCVERRARDIAG